MFNSSTMTDGCTNTHESSWNWLLAVTEEIFTCLELQIVFAHLQMSVQNFLHAMIRLNQKITQTCYRFWQVSYSSCVWRKLDSLRSDTCEVKYFVISLLPKFSRLLSGVTSYSSWERTNTCTDINQLVTCHNTCFRNKQTNKKCSFVFVPLHPGVQCNTANRSVSHRRVETVVSQRAASRTDCNSLALTDRKRRF